MSGYMDIFDVSGAGMRLERLRLETSALNIANAHTTRGPDGSLYRPLRVVSRANMAAFEQNLLSGAPLAGLNAYELLPAAIQPRLVYDPGHPHADAKGYVAMPGVNPLIEMTQIMAAVRAYEANVKAIEAARAMAQRALDIGSR